MRDPFVAALDAQFRAPGSAAAEYISASGVSRQIRVIVSQPDQDVSLGRARLVKGSAVVEIRRFDVLKPVPGEIVRLIDATVGRSEDGGVSILTIYGEPKLDTEGLTWVCGAVPAA